MIPITVRVQLEDFDFNAEAERLKAAAKDVGALVTFTGICRDEGGRLAGLELEHYPGMAEEELTRIARQAAERWPLAGVTVVHRHGRLRPGDNIVLVITASSHRQAALEAASFLMDFLKTRAPFWKKEHAAGAERWVAAKESDDQAAEKWERG
jgi:molybdopterin synthase catalytic subunit